MPDKTFSVPLFNPSPVDYGPLCNSRSTVRYLRRLYLHGKITQRRYYPSSWRAAVHWSSTLSRRDPLLILRTHWIFTWTSGWCKWGESLSRENVVSQKDRDIAAEIFSRHMKRVEPVNTDPDEVMSLHDSTYFLKGLKANAMWVANFMRKNNIHSLKGLGQAGHDGTKYVLNARKGLKTELCMTKNKSISNNDEVEVLYLSSRAEQLQTLQNLPHLHASRIYWKISLQYLRTVERLHKLPLESPNVRGNSRDTSMPPSIWEHFKSPRRMRGIRKSFEHPSYLDLTKPLVSRIGMSLISLKISPLMKLTKAYIATGSRS